MIRVDGLAGIERDDRSVITVGTFDGVHRGHQKILQYLTERARKRDGRSTVVSFDPHPREVVRDESVPLLTTIDERSELLDAAGIDRFVIIPFTREFSQRSAENFASDILYERVGLQEIVVGYDHGFGKGRKGDVSTLEELGEERGFTVDVIPAQYQSGPASGENGEAVISSTRIRKLLLEYGKVSEAEGLLGRRYSFTGTVVKGEGRGRQLGYPTANLRPDDQRKLIPKKGVYAVTAHLPSQGATRGGMMNIGSRPTFEDEGLHLEVHLFDWKDDLYGQEVRVEFVRHIRNEQQFDSVDALKKQLSRDEVRCKKLLD